MYIQWIVDGIFGDARHGYQATLASNRYRALLPASGLESLGNKVEFNAAEHWAPGSGQPSSAPDVIVIGKLLPSVDTSDFFRISESLIAGVLTARRSGIPVLADINDDHFEHPVLGKHWLGIVNAVDAVVAGSEAMAEVIRGHTTKPVFVVGDPIASPYAEPTVFRREAGWQGVLLNILNGLGVLKSRLQLIWYGNPSNWDGMATWAKRLLPLAGEHPFMLRVVTRPNCGVEEFVAHFNAQNRPNALMEFVPWDEITLWESVQQAHIVLIPAELSDKRKSVKTTNRLVDAINSGRIVVASPVPSYQEYKDVAWLGDDLLQGVRWCIAHPGDALEKIHHGQSRVAATHSVAEIARQWMWAIELTATKATPPVDIHPADTGAASSVNPADVGGIFGTHDAAKTPIRLNLGCGDKILDGYINVDVAPSRAGKEPDVLCDLHRLEPFANDEADEILAVHVVEHFWRWEVVDILKEWTRVLKPGGRMILECPNLISACQAFLADSSQRSRPDKNGQTTMWVFYGDPGWKDPLMVHRWGYTPESLGNVMREAGLVDIRQEPAQFKLREPRDMRIVGAKPISFVAAVPN